MNIYDFISAQDKRLVDIMDKLEDSTAGEPGIRGMLINQARIQFGALARVEGEHFYPALELFDETKEVSEKHRGMVREISAAMDELERANPADAATGNLIEAIHSRVETYVKSKEDELFSEVRDIIPDDLAENLGRVADQDINRHRRKLAGEAG